MNRARAIGRIAVQRELTVIFALAMALLFISQAGAQQPLLTRHVRDAVLNGQALPVGRLPETQVLQLDIVLPLRDPAGLDAFLSELYDPGSPSYRQFLTPQEFTARFGPSQADYDAVVGFLKANGFIVVGGTRDGMDVQVKAPVSAIETAFHLKMRTYRHPTENRVFYGPDSEPIVALPSPLWHISGLDNFSIPHPQFVKRSDYAAANGISPEAVVSHATTGSGPSASFLGSDMRAAYYGGTALTGAGQNLGLFEFLGTDLSDLTTYFNNVRQTNHVPVTLLSTDGTSTNCVHSSGCDDTEQTLDMTQALGMAPGLSSLVMYIGSTDTAIISAMTTHSPLPTTIGCSWGWTPADPSALDPYFERMAAQGQNFFVASGDNSTWKATGDAAAWPADDANIVSVGGTDLTTVSAGGPRASETAWSDSGGGISPDGIAIPSWQKLSGVIDSANRGSTTRRNGPDVSANANFTFYVCGNQTSCVANEIGGTSFAAPMWAGYIALANQQYAANNPSAAVKSLGFIDPLIYAIGTGSNYGTDFHDVISGTSGSYSAVVGYDLVTGWGSPNGANLINALTGSAGACTPTAIVPFISVNGGGSWTEETSATVSSTSTAVDLGPQPTSGGSWSWTGPNGYTSTSRQIDSIPLSVGSNVYTATYTNSGGCKSTQAFTITVTGGGSSPSFSLSDSPSSVSIKPGASGTSTIRVASSNGFDSAVALKVSGLPSGVTASLSSGSVTPPAGGSATSTLTLTASSSAPASATTVTVTGTSGSLSASTTIALAVTSSGGGGGGSLTLSPSSYNFGSTPAGTGTAWATFTLTNSGSSAVSISSVGVSGPFVVSSNCGSSVAAASSCPIYVYFAPTSAGSFTGTLTVTDSGTQTAALSGTGS